VISSWEDAGAITIGMTILSRLRTIFVSSGRQRVHAISGLSGRPKIFGELMKRDLAKMAIQHIEHIMSDVDR
jgi:hypothetical protein